MDKLRIEKIEREFYLANLRMVTDYALYILCFIVGGAIAFYWLKEASMKEASQEIEED